MGYKYKREIIDDSFISDKDLQLYNYGIQKCHSGHSWGPGIKDHIKLHIILKGSGTYTVDGNTYELSEGDVFLSLPHKRIYYEASQNDPWEYTWISFDGIKAKDYLRLTKLSESKPFGHIKKSKLELIRYSVMELKELQTMFQVSELLETSHLYKVLGILQRDKEAINITDSVKESYIKCGLEFITMNYSSSINCEKIAKHVGIHRKYLTKLFNAYLEVTPLQYLIQFRMDKAKKLLKETNLTVSEISYSVGYKDPGVFSKTFKRLNNLSPNNYRKDLGLVNLKS